MEQAPRGRRFAGAGLGDQQYGLLPSRERRRVEEVEIAPPLLKLDGEVLLQLEKECSDVVGGRQLCVPAPDQDLAGARRVNRVGERGLARGAGLGAAEGAENPPDRLVVLAGLAGNRDVLTEQLEP
jgi:hypothetical protein